MLLKTSEVMDQAKSTNGGVGGHNTTDLLNLEKNKNFVRTAACFHLSRLSYNQNVYYYNRTITCNRCVWGKKRTGRTEGLTAKVQTPYLEPFSDY